MNPDIPIIVIIGRVPFEERDFSNIPQFEQLDLFPGENIFYINNPKTEDPDNIWTPVEPLLNCI